MVNGFAKLVTTSTPKSMCLNVYPLRSLPNNKTTFITIFTFCATTTSYHTSHAGKRPKTCQSKRRSPRRRTRRKTRKQCWISWRGRQKYKQSRACRRVRRKLTTKLMDKISYNSSSSTCKWNTFLKYKSPTILLGQEISWVSFTCWAKGYKSKPDGFRVWFQWKMSKMIGSSFSRRD